jgi:lysophospholipase L1-like esterase
MDGGAAVSAARGLTELVRRIRRPFLGAVTGLGLAVAVVLALPGTAAVSPAGIATLGTAGSMAQQPVYRLPQRYYLGLGDSMAYGFQPTKVKPGARPSDFDTGYVDVFAARLRKLSPKIEIVNYGCPGESTVTFIRGGWRCDGINLHDTFRGSQLEAARSFLRAHPGEVSPITVTLWGAELAPLSARGKQAKSAIASVATRFHSILRQLRAAAPTAEIIVTGAWNPEADRLRQVEPLYRSVDAAIARAAAASRARVANMFAALNGRGSAKAQQARLCRLTFYCSKGDPHPTDPGYRAMAEAFTIASDYPRRP